MPQLGPQYDLAKRLADLEDQVRRLQANQIGQAFSATQSDGSVGLQIVQSIAGSGATSTTWYQGPTTSRSATTGLHPVLLYIGEVWSGGVAQNSALLAYRPNGGQILAMGNGGFEFRDLTASSTANGNIVISTDQASQEGLATPWIPLPAPQPTGVANWPKTTSSGSVAQCSFWAQHPKVWWSASAYADAATSGTVQLTLSNGTASVSSASHAVSATTFTTISDVLTLPQPFANSGWNATVNVTASGGGNVYCQTFAFYGRQS